MTKEQALAAADLLNMQEVEHASGRAWSVRHSGVREWWEVQLLSDEPIPCGVKRCYASLRSVLEDVLAGLE